MPHVIVDGARIAYADSGTGDPLLLLHGYPQNHRAWRHQQAALSRDRRVIAPDWLGWGDSDRRSDLSCAFDVEIARVAALLDALGLERVDLARAFLRAVLGMRSSSCSSARQPRRSSLTDCSGREIPDPEEARGMSSGTSE